MKALAIAFVLFGALLPAWSQSAAWMPVKGSTPELYYVAGGHRHYIGSMALIANLGYGENAGLLTLNDDQLNAIPKGDPMPDIPARLVVGHPSGQVYWLDRGVKFPIDKDDLKAMATAAPQTSDDAALGIIPTAPRLWWPVKTASSDEVVLVFRGQRWKVYSMNWLYAQGFKDADIRVVSPDILAGYKDQGPMPGVDGSLLQGDDGLLYVLDLGIKRPLAGTAQSAGIASPAAKADAATIAFFPTGPAVGIK